MDIQFRPFDAELRRLAPQTLLNYRDSVRAALETERRHAIAARWTEGLLMFRGFRQDYSFYSKRAGAAVTTAASAHAVWEVVSAIGGAAGYYYMDVLWDVRAGMDWLNGKPGRSKWRRHPTDLRLGDQIDSWTVQALEPGRRLTLQFGMRAPGSGVLEFEIAPKPDGRTRLSITAYWHPHGAWGLSYWYAMAPAHLIIFRGMAEAIARRAEGVDRRDAAQSTKQPPAE